MSVREHFVSSKHATTGTAALPAAPASAFALVSDGERRVWDSNPRTESPLLAVFKSHEFVTRPAVSARVGSFQQVISGPPYLVGPPFGVPQCGTREQSVSTPLAA